MYAAYVGNDIIVNLLLDGGADPNLGTREGTTPLMLAAGCGNANACYLLLQVSFSRLNLPLCYVILHRPFWCSTLLPISLLPLFHLPLFFLTPSFTPSLFPPLTSFPPHLSLPLPFPYLSSHNSPFPPLPSHTSPFSFLPSPTSLPPHLSPTSHTVLCKHQCPELSRTHSSHVGHSSGSPGGRAAAAGDGG